MGIESIGSAVAAQTYPSSSVKPVTEPVSVKANVETSASSQSTALNQPVAVGQAAASDQKEKYGDTDGKKQSNENTATMKDVNEINKLINQNTIAEFGYNEPTNRITIKIKDKETDEVIKEIPSEKALEMLAKVWELAGLLVDERR